MLKIYATLTKALKQACAWRLIPLDVYESVTLPRLDNGEVKPLDAKQMRALLKAAEGTELYAHWVL